MRQSNKDLTLSSTIKFIAVLPYDRLGNILLSCSALGYECQLFDRFIPSRTSRKKDIRKVKEGSLVWIHDRL